MIELRRPTHDLNMAAVRLPFVSIDRETTRMLLLISPRL